jgi:hypothetical protein
MTLVFLAFVSHLYLLGTVDLDLRYVSPCLNSSARVMMERLELNASPAKQSSKCSREDHVLKLMRILTDSR